MIAMKRNHDHKTLVSKPFYKRLAYCFKGLVDHHHGKENRGTQWAWKSN